MHSTLGFSIESNASFEVGSGSGCLDDIVISC